VVTRKVATREEAHALGSLVKGYAPEAILAQIHLGEDTWTSLEAYLMNAPDVDAPGPAHSGRPDGDLLAVSSIAEPEGFHEMVRSGARGVVECMAFPDHHEFRPKDVRRIVERAGGRSVVTTEKDAVKLVRFSGQLPTTYVLRLRVTWEFGQDAVMELIMRALDSGKAR
jgi:tetraacyldisaccharide-1-P 4'-kinase